MVAYGTTAPFAGPGGMTDVNWRDIGSSWGDGIVNALGSAGTSSFALGRSASDRTVTLHLDEIRVRGYHFKPSQSTLALTVPAVAAGSTRADRLLVKYDPTAAVADRITFYIKAGTAVTTGTPSFPTFSRVVGGVWEVPLYTWTGGNVSADALEVTDQRVFISERLHVLSRPGLNSELNLGRSDGAQAFDYSTGHTWVCTYPGGVATWTDLDNPPWSNVNIGTSLKAGVAAPQYSVSRGRVYFRGEAGPTSGPWSGGPGKGLGQVPVEIAPSFTRVFPIALKNMSNRTYLTGRVYVEPTAQITLDLPEVTGLTVGSVDYSSISYELGA